MTTKLAQSAPELTDRQRKLLDELFDGIYVVDMAGKIVFWNKASEGMTGFSCVEVVGKACSDNILMHVDDGGACLCVDGCPMKAAREENRPLQADVYLHHKDGHRVPVSVRAAPMHDEFGNVVGAIEIFSDRTQQADDRKRLEEMKRLALNDELSGLPNRRFLNQQLEMKLAELLRIGIPFGVLMIDIDHFKMINDTCGHDGGDHVIKTVSKTLSAAMRPYDFTGRWGGEEFLTIVSFADAAQLGEIAERLRFLIETSLPVFKGKQIPVTVSIGGTCAVTGETQESLVERADRLLYKSKEAGRNRVTMG